MNSGRVVQIKATYYNPVHKQTNKLVINYTYELIPMAVAKFGKCFNLDCNKEVMPYDAYTYENVSMCACSIQSALYIIKDEDKPQLFK